MRTKIFIVCILACILIGGFAAYFSGVFVSTGKRVQVAPPQEQKYTNEKFGVSFSHLDSYELQERSITINKEEVHIITLTPKGAAIPENGEGSTAITLSIFTTKPESLKDWLKAMSNVSPSGEGGPTYVESVVGGEKALSYTSTGLYESTNIAVEKKGLVYVFSSSWMTKDDQILKDFDTLITSVAFTK